MSRARLVLGIGLVLTLGACASQLQNDIFFDPQAKLDTSRSLAFTTGSGGTDANRKIAGTEIRTLLAAKGYRFTDQGRADLLVRFDMGRKAKVKLSCADRRCAVATVSLAGPPSAFSRAAFSSKVRLLDFPVDRLAGGWDGPGGAQTEPNEQRDDRQHRQESAHTASPVGRPPIGSQQNGVRDRPGSNHKTRCWNWRYLRMIRRSCCETAGWVERMATRTD